MNELDVINFLSNKLTTDGFLFHIFENSILIGTRTKGYASKILVEKIKSLSMFNITVSNMNSTLSKKFIAGVDTNNNTLIFIKDKKNIIDVIN